MRHTLLALALVLGCTTPERKESSPSDSSPLPAIGGGKVDSTALVCEPLVTPSATFGRIGAIAPGADQRLVWADLTSGHFMAHDAKGTLHEGGKVGDGEGEFQLMGAMGWLGDRFWISDLRQRRVQFFDETGHFKHAVTLGQASMVWTPRPDGRFLGLATKPDADTVWAVVSMREGKPRVDTIATFPAPAIPQVKIPLGDGGSLFIMDPFATQTRVVRSDDGARWCGAMPHTGGLRLKCVTDLGAPIYDTTFTLTSREVPAAVYDSVLGALITTYHADMGTLLGLLLPNSTMLYVSGMRVDVRGDVWINRSHPTEPATMWIRFRRDGALRDTLVIPSHLEPKALRNDTIWGADVSTKEQQPVVVRCTVRDRRSEIRGP